MLSKKRSQDPKLKELKVILPDIQRHSVMRAALATSAFKTKRSQTTGDWDDDNVRYKLNSSYSQTKPAKSALCKKRGSPSVLPKLTDEYLYKLPETKPSATSLPKNAKSKTRIKVKFWSSKVNKDAKPSANVSAKKAKVTPGNSKATSPKVRQKVSFLPLPEFTDQHAPMVTVPDDLTVHFNEEEANDLLITGDSMKSANNSGATSSPRRSPVQKVSQSPQTSPKGEPKRKRDGDVSNVDLEYFAKYVVQKLRKMETNQRIYSENLINTVLMLGQLKQLNGKSKVSET